MRASEVGDRRRRQHRFVHGSPSLRHPVRFQTLRVHVHALPNVSFAAPGVGVARVRELLGMRLRRTKVLFGIVGFVSCARRGSLVLSNDWCVSSYRSRTVLFPRWHGRGPWSTPVASRCAPSSCLAVPGRDGRRTFPFRTRARHHHALGTRQSRAGSSGTSFCTPGGPNGGHLRRGERAHVERGGAMRRTSNGSNWTCVAPCVSLKAHPGETVVKRTGGRARGSNTFSGEPIVVTGGGCEGWGGKNTVVTPGGEARRVVKWETRWKGHTSVERVQGAVAGTRRERTHWDREKAGIKRGRNLEVPGNETTKREE
eukprot:scaffold2636_cov340-Pavlova_lutheri.AAC.119